MQERTPKSDNHDLSSELIEEKSIDSDHGTELGHEMGAKSRGVRNKAPKWVIVLLALVFLLAAYFRFTGFEWDESYHLHPDERFLTDVAGLLKSTDPITYLKTSASTLNPYNVGKSFYVYGNFPMTITRLAAELADGFCQEFQSVCERRFIFYDGIHLVGRFLSALVDLISILFTYLIGKRLYDWRVGLIGAFLMAAAVMAIQQSHFFTMDNWAAGLTMIALYTAVRASEKGSRKIWWALFGLSLGLAVASRINLAPLAGMAVVAAGLWLIRRSYENGDGNWRYLLTNQGSIDLQKVILGLFIAAVVSLIVFRLAQPYAFADPEIIRENSIAETGQIPGTVETIVRSIIGFNPQWRANMTEIQGLQSPDASFPPALQWTSRTPLLFPLTNMILWGMGIAAGIAAIGGFIWALWRILRRYPGWESHVLLVSWAGLYFIFMGLRWVKSVRYFLPIYPALMLLAGWALIELWKKAGQNRGRQALAIAALLLVTVSTLLWANAFVEIYRQPVTRVEASAWIFDNVPTGATLIYDSGGMEQELQLPLRRYEFWPGSPPLFLNFSLPEDGVATGIRFNYLSDTDIQGGTDSGEQLQVRLVESTTGSDLVKTISDLDLSGERESFLLELPDIPLNAELNYTVVAESLNGGPITASTSILANEHWDDPLPVRFEGRDPFSSYYEGVSVGLLPITNPDSEQKRDDFIHWLDESDYIILSSQRALWSLPRLPRTYPMTTRYYDALFKGELGFELVRDFQGDISIGPLQISDVGGVLGWGDRPQIGWPPPGDLSVEEAFSVYDHPPVWIFAKNDDFSLDSVAAILEEVDLDEAVFMTPGEATRAPGGMQLSSEDQQERQQDGTFSQLFDIDALLARHPWLAAVLWWLAVVVLSWVAFPLTSLVFKGLPDRGFPLARILSLLIVAYLSWLLGSLDILPSNQTTLLLALIALLIISLTVLFIRREEIISFISNNLRYILFIELLGLGLYLLFIFIRIGNPDVWDVIWGGEKPMDLAYFNAVLKSDSFPPYDPWFAGGYINYYYFGYVYVGALTELLAIVPTIAYNLILPMLFSFTGVAAFSIAYNLVARNVARSRSPAVKLNARTAPEKSIWVNKGIWAGVLAAALCILLGNLAEVPVMLNAWQQASDTTTATGIAPVDAVIRTFDGAADVILTDRTVPIYTGDWFWLASRAILVEPGEVQPITEFPFFTFLYGDLHAHMIALPITLLALAWAVSVALTPGQDNSNGRKKTGIGELIVTLLVGSMTVGALWATNTWDFPTYLVLAILALSYFAIRRRGRIDLTAIGSALVLSLAFLGLSILLYLPFTANYGRAYSSFSLWQGSYTSLLSYFAVFGLFLFIISIHLIGEFRSWSATWTTESLARWEPYTLLVFAGLIGTLIIAIFLLSRGYTIAPLVLTLTLAAGLLGLRRGLPIERRIPLILISAALALTLIVEIIVLDGDIGRMNTVFKFYLQVWVMLSVAAGVAAVWIGTALKYRRTLRRLWQVGLVLLILVAALYPILATKAKWDIRMSDEAPLTLDGMAFMKSTSYMDTGFDGSSQKIDLQYDYDAIRWMQRNIQGSPVIAEANSSNPYRSIGSRVSMYTGLPAIVGWDWHQRQQRALMPGSLVTDRINDVITLYNTSDINEALEILNKYDVSYIYAGPLESAYYHPQGLLKFEDMANQGLLREVYRNEGVTIFEVVRANA